MQRPIRILELSAAEGDGGGPDKTILLGTARTDVSRVAITVCYLHTNGNGTFGIGRRARELGLDYVGISERGKLDFRAWTAVGRLVRERNIDIVHSHGYKADLIALWLSRRTGALPLATVHGYTGESFRERRLYYPLDRWVLKGFPLVITVSTELRERLTRAGVPSRRIRTVLNSIDPRKFYRRPDEVTSCRAEFDLTPEDVVVGAVGRIEPQKRFDYLLKAFVLLLPRYPKLRLRVAGEGTLRAALEEQTHQLGLGSVCRFVGHQSEVGRFYQALDLFVQSSEYEGTPNVVLEAMAYEVPIVATRVGGTDELIEHERHGLVVPPGDPEHLAAGIERALEEREATRERAALARRRVEQELSFAARMEAVEQIYEELICRFPHKTCRGRTGVGPSGHESAEGMAR